MPKADILNTAPSRLRALPARGIEAGEQQVDRDGGDSGSGVIRGLAVVTRGEALGHGHWIDTEFLRQVAEAINVEQFGIKSRFTHPDISADGLGKFLGRAKQGRVAGDLVRADLHFSPAAHDTPDGDLAGYVMTLAENDPAAFGTSIVFEHDRKAETEFMLAHGATVDEHGWLDSRTFRSPDPLNTENFPHVRLAALWADDVVDEPAANPNGLFHRGQELAQEADAFLEYALGLADQAPVMSSLEIDPDRAAGFVSRFLTSHGLELRKKENTMPTKQSATPTSDPTKKPAYTVPEEEPKKEGEGEEEPNEPKKEGEEEPEDPEKDKKATAQNADPRAEVKRYLAAFGPDGATWYAEGLTFEQAKDKQIAKLTARVTALETTLKAVNRGEAEPVQFQSGDKDPRTAAAAKYEGHLGENLSKVAAATEAAMATGGRK